MLSHSPFFAMAGLHDGPNSVFVDPPLDGERAARRVVNEVVFETRELPRLHVLASSSQTNRTVTQANNSRLNLERGVSALQRLTNVPENMTKRVTDAFNAGTAILTEHEPIVRRSGSTVSVAPSDQDRAEPPIEPRRRAGSELNLLNGSSNGRPSVDPLVLSGSSERRPDEELVFPLVGSSSGRPFNDPLVLSGSSERRPDEEPVIPLGGSSSGRPLNDANVRPGALATENPAVFQTLESDSLSGSRPSDGSQQTSFGTPVGNDRPTGAMDSERLSQRTPFQTNGAASAGSSVENHRPSLSEVASRAFGAASDGATLQAGAAPFQHPQPMYGATGSGVASASGAALPGGATPQTGQYRTGREGEAVRNSVNFNAPKEREKIIRRYEELRQKMQNEYRQELSQIAEIADEHAVSQFTLPNTVAPLQEQVPPDKHMHVPSHTHPHDQVQNQLRAQLQAHTLGPPPVSSHVQSQAPTYNSAPAHTPPGVGNYGQARHYQVNPPLIASPSTHTAQNANPYAYLTPQPSSQNLPMGSGSLGGQDLAASLLTVNLRQHGRDLMIAGRPGNKSKFSGKPHQDFESVMATFDRVTNLPGITDEMRCLELRHWLEGSPLIILTQYDKISDGSVAYQRIRSHLDRTYGRKVFTAREMLEELLVGVKLKDPTEIEEFILRMEKTYVDAVMTHRDATFSTNDTFNEILRKKLPSFYGDKWAHNKTKADNKYMEDRSKPYGLTFSFFIDFCRGMNDTSKNRKAIHRDANIGASKGPTERNGAGDKNGSKAAKNYKVAATVVDIAATEIAATDVKRQPFKGKKPQKGFQTHQPRAHSQQSSSANSTSTRAATPPPLNKSVSGGMSCLCCENSSHSTMKCRAFAKKTDEEKNTFVKSNRICFKCLEKGHMSGKCPNSIECDTCGSSRHNTHFHSFFANK